MFDDIQEDPKPTPQTPANALDNSGNEIQQSTPPKRFFGEEKSDSEPEDIFDKVDGGDKDDEVDYINQPPNAKLAANFGQSEEEEEEMQSLSYKKNSKIKIIIIIIVFLVAIGVAWLAYTYFIKSNPDSAVEENNIEQINNANNLSASINTDDQNLNKNANTIIETIKPIDTDGDGLTDDDEIDFGTDLKLIDTDGDGLTDQEEVIKYKTNPHNTDSDSDSYIDGDEIKNGYNPLGEGKLIDKVELP